MPTKSQKSPKAKPAKAVDDDSSSSASVSARLQSIWESTLDLEPMLRNKLQALIIESTSVAAAAQFIKTHAKDMNLPNDWQDNYDIAVLATMMGIPKEGPSAGITIVTGIVSALTGRPVRNEITMTGEITIMGKVLAIGGVVPKLQAAIEAGCKQVIMPKENERDVQMTPDYVKNKIKVHFVSSIDEVLAHALLDCKS